MYRLLITAVYFNTFSFEELHKGGVCISITNERLPWLIDINVFMTPISHVNWNTNTQSETMLRSGYRTSAGAINNEISYDLVLAEGTWSVELLYLKGPDAGIFSIQIDSVDKGTIDAYTAGTSDDNRSTVTGIVVSEAGKHRLTLKMAAKNASSSNYYGRIQHIQLRRTA